jgi:hypothetical protein
MKLCENNFQHKNNLINEKIQVLINLTEFAEAGVARVSAEPVT